MTRSSRQRGFVLAAVLVTGGLAALLVIDALTTAALAQAMVTRLRLRQEVFELAESALASLAVRLAEEGSDSLAIERRVGAATVTATARLRAREDAPQGFSARHFRLEHFDLEANASAPRGTRLVLQAGLSRWSSLP